MAIMLPAALARTESGAVTACRFEPAGAAKVRAISDGRSFILEDGREIRLAGIEVPLLPPAGGSGPDAEAALAVRAALAAMVVDRTVELRQNGAPADRYGRTLALAYVAGAEARRSVAHEMLARGFARVAAHIGDRACAEELLAQERSARRAKLGLWSEPYYVIVAADSAAELSAARHAGGRQSVVGARERRNDLHQFRAAMGTSAHGHHFQARREWLHRRRGSAENARGPPPPGARVGGGAQRTAHRCDPPGADRNRRAQLTD
jgi:endonuclease YncB( thermonuclease family)